MDSLKETDNLATKPSKRPRIEVDEELMRQMIAGQAPLDSKVIRRIPSQKDSAAGFRTHVLCPGGLP